VQLDSVKPEKRNGTCVAHFTLLIYLLTVVP
jgi:hypothetical protein